VEGVDYVRAGFLEALLIVHCFGHVSCLVYNVVVLLAGTGWGLWCVHYYYTGISKENQEEKTNIT